MIVGGGETIPPSPPGGSNSNSGGLASVTTMFSHTVSENDLLTVTNIRRLSHPYYSMSNNFYGSIDPYNLDQTRLLMYEMSNGDASPTADGRFYVWGYVDETYCQTNNCLLNWETKADYEDAARQVPLIENDYHYRWRNLYWSPLVGEEDILYGVTIYDKEGVYKINLTSSEITEIANYNPNDGTNIDNASCYGFTFWNTFWCSFGDEYWGDGGFEVDIQTGDITFFGPNAIGTNNNYALTYCQEHENQTLPEAYKGYPHYSHGHGSLRRDQLYNAVGYGTSPVGVWNLNNCTFYPDNNYAEKYPNDLFWYFPNHVTWQNDQTNYFFGDSPNSYYDSSQREGHNTEPWLRRVSLFQSFFDEDSGDIFHHHLITMPTAGKWNEEAPYTCDHEFYDQCNYQWPATPLPFIDNTGRKLLFTNTNGSYSYGDYLLTGITPWDTYAVYMAELTPVSEVDACVDDDMDGFGENCYFGNDCNDNNHYIHPDADEIYDGIDNDCDGLIDCNDDSEITCSPKSIFVDVNSIGGVCSDSRSRISNSISSPFCTIERASFVALPSDTIYIRSGIYPESLIIDNGGSSLNHYVTFKAYQNEDVTIRPGKTFSNGWSSLGNGVYSRDFSSDNFNLSSLKAIKVNSYGLIETSSLANLQNSLYAPGEDLFFVDEEQNKVYLRVNIINPNNIYFVDSNSQIKIISPFVSFEDIKLEYAYRGFYVYFYGVWDDYSEHGHFFKSDNNIINHTYYEGIYSNRNNITIINSKLDYTNYPLKWDGSNLVANLDVGSIFLMGIGGLVENNIVTNSIIALDYRSNSYPPGFRVANMTFRNNIFNGRVVGSGFGNLFYNNIVKSDKTTGFSLYYETENNGVFNNLIYSLYGVLLSKYGVSQNVEFKNNVVYGIVGSTCVDFDIGNVSSFEMDYNVFYNCSSYRINGVTIGGGFNGYKTYMNSNYNIEENSFSTNPLLVDFTTYYPTENSPLIDSGYSLLNYFDEDIIGVERPQDGDDVSGALWDIGPYEYTASCTDGIHNGNELDVDCGGGCGSCPWESIEGYFVSPNGDDVTGDGSYINPWGTVDYGLTQMSTSGGDILNIMPGIHRGKVNRFRSGTFSNPNIIRGIPGSNTRDVIIDGSILLDDNDWYSLGGNKYYNDMPPTASGEKFEAMYLAYKDGNPLIMAREPELNEGYFEDIDADLSTDEYIVSPSISSYADHSLAGSKMIMRGVYENPQMTVPFDVIDNVGSRLYLSSFDKINYIDDALFDLAFYLEGSENFVDSENEYWNSSTIQNRIIIYSSDPTNISVPYDHDQIITLYDDSNIIIENLTLQNGKLENIFMERSPNITIRNIFSKSSNIGIYLYNSSNDILENIEADNAIARNYYLYKSLDITLSNISSYESSKTDSPIKVYRSSYINIDDCYFQSTDKMAMYIINSQNVDVQNCEFTNTSGGISVTSWSVASEDDLSNSVIIKNNYVHDFNYGSGVTVHYGRNVLIENNRFENGLFNGILLEGDKDHTWLMVPKNITVKDNYIYRVGPRTSDEISRWYWIAGIWVSDTDNSLIEGNIIMQNVSRGFAFDSSRNVTMRNNIIMGGMEYVPTKNTYGCISFNSGGGTSDFDQFVNNTIEHNTFYNCDRGLFFFIDDKDTNPVFDDNKIINNIIYNMNRSSVWIDYNLSSNNFFNNYLDYNLYYDDSNHEPLTFSIDGNIYADTYLSFENYSTNNAFNMDKNSFTSDPQLQNTVEFSYDEFVNNRDVYFLPIITSSVCGRAIDGGDIGAVNCPLPIEENPDDDNSGGGGGGSPGGSPPPLPDDPSPDDSNESNNNDSNQNNNNAGGSNNFDSGESETSPNTETPGNIINNTGNTSLENPGDTIPKNDLFSSISRMFGDTFSSLFTKGSGGIIFLISIIVVVVVGAGSMVAFKHFSSPTYNIAFDEQSTSSNNVVQEEVIAKPPEISFESFLKYNAPTDKYDVMAYIDTVTSSGLSEEQIEKLFERSGWSDNAIENALKDYKILKSEFGIYRFLETCKSNGLSKHDITLILLKNGWNEGQVLNKINRYWEKQ